MNALEARYRIALRWYPRSWREANGDAVVGTLLDAAEAEGRDVPRLADLLDLMLSGLSTRVAIAAGPRARSVVSAGAIATGLAYSLTQFLTSSWAPLAPSMRVYAGAATFGPFHDLGPILAALWLVAAIGAAARKSPLMRSALAAVVLTSASMEVARTLSYVSGSLSRFALVFEVSLAVLGLIGVPDRRRTIGLLAAGWLAVFVVIDLANGVWVSQSPLYLWVMGPANAAGLTMALTGTSLVAGALANVGRPQAATVVLLASLPWLLMWGIELVTNPFRYFEFPFPMGAGALLLIAYGSVLALIRRARRRGVPAG